jgi:hypothetical protein
MRLFGRDATSWERGARNPHDAQLPIQPGNLITPGLLPATVFFRECPARKPLTFRLRHKRPNARHHPPAHKTEVDESRRVAGRVHAVVRLRRVAKYSLL